MGRPRRNPAQAPTRDRILEQALGEFARSGFAHAKLEDIADAVGIRRPSLLYHFGSKEELHDAVVEAVFARLGAAMAPALAATGDFEARLRELVLAFVSFFDASPDAAAIIVRESLAAEGRGQELIAQRGEELLRTVEQWIERSAGARDDVPVRPALMQVVSDALLRNAGRPVLAPLWAESSAETSWRLVRRVLMEE